MLFGIGYAAFPGYRSDFLNFAPYLLFLACPIGMMMMRMNGMYSDNSDTAKQIKKPADGA